MGEPFTVSLMLDNAADVSAAPIQIVFDPKMLKLNDVTQGDLLSQGGTVATLTKNIQNDAGAAAIQLSRPPDKPGVNGNGTLLNFSFSPVMAGISQITAPNIAVRNSQGTTAATGSPQLTVHVKEKGK